MLTNKNNIIPTDAANRAFSRAYAPSASRVYVRVPVGVGTGGYRVTSCLYPALRTQKIDVLFNFYNYY